MSHNVQHDVIITGVPPAPGSAQPKAYPRRPIEELVRDEKQFALYVQATDLMMKTKAADMLSWFQVGGIHGAPKEPWDNVGGLSNPSWLGYCTHASVLFPTWHRPYVLLYEQALVGCAVKIAGRYTGADAGEWMQAAVSLRSPYWDWARNAVPPREVIEYATLTVPGPDGNELVLDPNPLLGYRFQSDAPQVDPRPQTVRCPTQSNPTVSNIQALITSLQVLDNPNDPMRDRVYDTLNDAQSWETFSNKRTSQGAFRNSLESIHDTIHVLVGGNGQMADPAVAAFDPMFWLHHTNVDRLLALWQALHPNTWVSSVTGPGEGGTFTISRNAHVNASTDLTPFWNAQTTFFKPSSPGVRQWQILNYDYPEFAQITPGSDARAAILAEVKRLYLDAEDDEDDVPAPTGAPLAPGQLPGATTTATTAVQNAAAASLHGTAEAVQQAARAVAPNPAAASVVASVAAGVLQAVAGGAQRAHAAVAPAPAPEVVQPSGGGQARPPAAGKGEGTQVASVPSAAEVNPRLDWTARIRFNAAKAESITLPLGGGQARPLAAGEGEATQVTFVHAAAPRPNTRLDWFARIRVKAAKVGSSFTVLLFVGEPPAEEHDWRSAENLIGVHAEFVNSRPGQCSNCQENAEVVTEGFIRLTRTLRKRGLYRRPEAEIEQFLSHGLEWRIQKIDATVVTADEVPGLEIAVMTVPLEFSQERHGWKKPDEIRPTHRNLTSGRAGGRPLPQQ